MATQKKSVLYCGNEQNNPTTKKLFDSISRGEELVTIQALLQEGADIDARDSKGRTPLLLAGFYVQEQIFDLLIKTGANVDAKCNDNEYTALHYAASYGWTKVVRSLVNKVRDLDAIDIRGNTPLHIATTFKCLEVVKCLLKQGADIDRKNLTGFTPLISSARTPVKNIFNLLLKSGANIDGDERILLYYALQNGWKMMVQSLLKSVPDLNNVIFEKALDATSSRRHLEVVKFLVEEGSGINRGNEMISHAALYQASRVGHLDIVEWLVKKGHGVKTIPDINKKTCLGSTALHIASRGGHLEVVKFLVEEGADINAKNRKDYTPLLLAAVYTKKDVVDLLMYSGANVHDAFIQYECTLLHSASAQQWIDVVKFLIKRGCDLDATNAFRMTALSYACLNQNLDIAQVLLQAGASWDTADKNGDSPLNYLTMQEKPKFRLIKLLIEKGAYLKPVDYDALVKSSSLEVLQDAKICSQAIINKFNNHYLPELYKLPASESLPRIEKMKVASGSEAAQAIEQNIEFEIQTKGHCNILEVCIMALSVFSVRSVLDYYGII